MTHIFRSKLVVIPFLILIGSGIFLAMIAHGTTPDDIVFPVAELGDCGSKQECKTFCDDPAHYDACIAFAKEHRLLNEQAIERSERFAALSRQGGPGGCVSKEECAAYCEDIRHLDVCLSYAEEHDLLDDDELVEARGIAAALQSGAQLPGDCSSKQECETYCEDGRHLRECIAFAEQAGLVDTQELQEMKKILPLMESGQMPGGCTSKSECDAYCSQGDHFEECIDFAVRAGFVSEEEAEMARHTGGQGPGGCTSKEECDAFCNNPQNLDTCISFAQEHGLMSAEEAARVKENIGQLKTGFQQAPPELRACLVDELGPELVAQIESGELVPGDEVSARMNRCFDAHKDRMMEEGAAQIRQMLAEAPPESHECLADAFGPAYREQLLAGEIDPDAMEDIVHECMMRPHQEEMSENLRHMLSSGDTEVLVCLQQVLGSDRVTLLRSGGVVELDDEMGEELRECFDAFRHQMEQSDPVRIHSDREESAHMEGDVLEGPLMELPPMPPEVQTCMQQLYGEDVFDRMMTGQFVPPHDMQSQIEQCVRESFSTHMPDEQM